MRVARFRCKIGTFAQLGTALMSFSMGDVSARGPFFTYRQEQCPIGTPNRCRRHCRAPGGTLRACGTQPSLLLAWAVRSRSRPPAALLVQPSSVHTRMQAVRSRTRPAASLLVRSGSCDASCKTCACHSVTRVRAAAVQAAGAWLPCGQLVRTPVSRSARRTGTGSPASRCPGPPCSGWTRGG